MERASHARGPTRILRDAARNGQDLAPTKTDTATPATEPGRLDTLDTNANTTPTPIQPQQPRRAPILRHPAASSATWDDWQGADEDARNGSVPLIAQIGALQEAQRAAQAAHAIRSRLEYLATAPAAQLATPYQVRRTARDMLRDAAILCQGLDALATREGIARILRARAPYHQAPSRSGEGRGDAS